MTRTIFILLLIMGTLSLRAQPAPEALLSPLSSFSAEWNKPAYMALNTAKDSNYLTAMEKDVIWILNLVRYDPRLFLNTVLLDPKSEFYVLPKYQDHYHSSLITELKKLKPDPTPMTPDRELFRSARCHAENSGKEGYVGHDRKWDCFTRFSGECISYGYDDALDIIMQLLIDRGVPSLGHRSICLSSLYDELGVSIQPHIAYSYNAVLDFH